MYCDECQKKPAAVHLTKIINGEKSEVHLCEDCAQAQHKEWTLGIDANFPLNKFLAGLLGYDPQATGASMNLTFTPPEKCESCGFNYNQMSQIGRFGCNRCYKHFKDKVGPLLRRVQGSNRHTGKVPQRTGGTIRLEREIQSLRLALQEHVVREEFEEAAKVRDQIREIEKKLGR
ncbi:UvrB/UvrC motif-containing protein [Heliorestis convoluta]|uniref:UvrB/UvrC protein, putative n=1 Tax=Heliorestis convoluta TaxID=356322 RepID=A0A5Q2NAC3_9FIRM|nr:UvrB/UvrC motif-containing protein [Heliorestis convoluta]QGG49220.1 UvrB/UvrC protein, putative [Heliorestis convoluta]